MCKLHFENSFFKFQCVNCCVKTELFDQKVQNSTDTVSHRGIQWVKEDHSCYVHLNSKHPRQKTCCLLCSSLSPDSESYLILCCISLPKPAFQLVFIISLKLHPSRKVCLAGLYYTLMPLKSNSKLSGRLTKRIKAVMPAPISVCRRHRRV